MKLVITGLVVWLLLFSAHGQFVDDLVTGRMTVRKAVIPFYVEAEQEPSLVVSADRIYTDYERRGFFRIGLFPVGVMEGVAFEVRHPNSVTNSFAQCHHWISRQAARRLEFRQVTFETSGGTINRLQCGRTRIVSDENWELLNGVSFRSGTNQTYAPRATLCVAGEHIGRLVMFTSPPLTNNLFDRVSYSAVTQKETP